MITVERATSQSVPNVVGLSSGDASRALLALGFRALFVTPDGACGSVGYGHTVIQQVPWAGRLTTAGTDVAVYVD